MNPTNNRKNSQYHLYKRLKQQFQSQFIINQRRDTDRNKTDASQTENKPAEIDKRRDRVKWTDVAMVIITFFLAWYTFQLFKETSNAGKITEQAVAEAKRANDLAIRRDSTANVNQRIQDSLTHIKDSISNKNINSSLAIAKQNSDAAVQAVEEQRKANINTAVSLDLQKTAIKEAQDENRKRFVFDSISLSAQMTSVDEAKKEFDIESRPYVQISNISVDSISNKGDLVFLVIKFKIVNMGRFVAKMVSQRLRAIHYIKSADEPSYKKFDSNSLLSLGEGSPSEIFLSPVFGNEFTPYTKVPLELSNDCYKEFKRGERFLYILGKLVYQSWTGNKRYSFTFGYKIKQVSKDLETIPYTLDEKEIILSPTQ